MTAVGTWAERAACKGLDPGLFHPAAGHDVHAQRAAVAAAKNICATCPAERDCLAAAMADPRQLGIAGGLTHRERQGLRVLARHGPLTGSRREQAKQLRAGGATWREVGAVLGTTAGEARRAVGA